MKNILIALVVATACFVLAGCERPEPVSSRSVVNSAGLVDKIEDWGKVDGCHVKFVFTNVHPNFWFIRCDDRITTTTHYETGGKVKTLSSSVIVE